MNAIIGINDIGGYKIPKCRTKSKVVKKIAITTPVVELIKIADKVKNNVTKKQISNSTTKEGVLGLVKMIKRIVASQKIIVKIKVGK